MSGYATSTTVTTLDASDLVAVAQCIVVDAEAFPYASTQFGLRSRVVEILVARAGRDPPVLGFAATRRRHGDLEIEGLAVRREVRRRGIGRALLRAVIEGARARPVTTVSLHVWAGNASAIEMYRSEGFVVWRRLAGYYRAGTFDVSGDAEEMGLHIGQ